MKKSQEIEIFKQMLIDTSLQKFPAGFTSLSLEELINATKEVIKQILKEGINAGEIGKSLERISAVNDFLYAQISSRDHIQTLRSRKMVYNEGIDELSIIKEGLKGPIVRSVIKELNLGEKEIKMLKNGLLEREKKLNSISPI